MTVTPDSPDLRPRVGIPWRTVQEERSSTRQKLDYYFASLRRAGADPVAISLQQSQAQLADQLNQLDAFVLPGSPSDVDPARYAAARHPKTGEVDENRDRTDAAILEHALAAAKPVLAICYGCQALNVFLGGTLIQGTCASRRTLQTASSRPLNGRVTALGSSAFNGTRNVCLTIVSRTICFRILWLPCAPRVALSHHQASTHLRLGLTEPTGPNPGNRRARQCLAANLGFICSGGRNDFTRRQGSAHHWRFARHRRRSREALRAGGRGRNFQLQQS